MNNELFKIWKEAKTTFDYAVALWITVLAVVAGVGIVAMLYRIISDPGTVYI